MNTVSYLRKALNGSSPLGPVFGTAFAAALVCGRFADDGGGGPGGGGGTAEVSYPPLEVITCGFVPHVLENGLLCG